MILDEAYKNGDREKPIGRSPRVKDIVKLLNELADLSRNGGNLEKVAEIEERINQILDNYNENVVMEN